MQAQRKEAEREPDWHLYEQLKREWIAKNPNATDREWNKAMREIAARCGA